MHFEIFLGSLPVLVKRDYAQVIIIYSPLLLEKDKCDYSLLRERFAFVLPAGFQIVALLYSANYCIALLYSKSHSSVSRMAESTSATHLWLIYNN